ncbi:hypothetical protein GGI42DRAFT_185510 [Trichoderma sp. SZMC 28013]
MSMFILPCDVCTWYGRRRFENHTNRHTKSSHKYFLRPCPECRRLGKTLATFRLQPPRLFPTLHITNRQSVGCFFSSPQKSCASHDSSKPGGNEAISRQSLGFLSGLLAVRGVVRGTSSTDKVAAGIIALDERLLRHAAYCLGLMDITARTYDVRATGTAARCRQVLFPCRSVPCAPGCLSHAPQVATGSSFVIPYEQVSSQSSSREKRKYST